MQRKASARRRASRRGGAAVTVALFLLAPVGQVLDAAPAVGRIVMIPQTVHLYRDNSHVFVQARVFELDGMPIPGIDVDFSSSDRSITYFPYEKSVTDENGIASNYFYRVSTDPMALQPEVFASIDDVKSDSPTLMTHDLWVESAGMFAAPPLKPFNGSLQRLIGEIKGFGYLDPSDVHIWSLDPTIAVAENYALDLDPRKGQILELDVRARRTGQTFFLFEQPDVAIYRVDVMGELFPRFIRADGDDDGIIDLSDPVLFLNDLFLGEKEVPCREAADSDDSGALDITDAVFTLSFRFLGGSRPSAPLPDPGPDPTPDLLGCR